MVLPGLCPGSTMRSYREDASKCLFLGMLPAVCACILQFFGIYGVHPETTNPSFCVYREKLKELKI